MLTIDDVRAILLFSTLAVTELERLAQTSADLHLGAGEFAVPEGGERALFAVLAGKIEVVKLTDGVQREYPRCFRVRGCVVEPSQTCGFRGWGRQHGDCFRPPVSAVGQTAAS
jgi:hypothetical protein